MMDRLHALTAMAAIVFGIVAGIAGTAILNGSAVASADVLFPTGKYSTCSEAAEDGVFNIPDGHEDYWDEGDRDGDGIACEQN